MINEGDDECRESRQRERETKEFMQREEKLVFLPCIVEVAFKSPEHVQVAAPIIRS